MRWKEVGVGGQTLAHHTSITRGGGRADWGKPIAPFLWG